MGGGKGGGGGRSTTVVDNPASAAAAEVSRQVFKEATTLRLSLINSIMQEFGLGSLRDEQVPLESRGKIPAAIPDLFGASPPEREQIESTFGRARENLRDVTPGRGSSFDRALTGIETGRAITMADLITGAKRRALAAAETVGFGQSNTALENLTRAAGSFSGTQTTSTRGGGKDKGGLGGGLGLIGTLALGRP